MSGHVSGHMPTTPTVASSVAVTQPDREPRIASLLPTERGGNPRASVQIGDGITAWIAAFRAWTPPGPKWTTVEELPFGYHACWKLDGIRLMVFGDRVPDEAGQCTDRREFSERVNVHKEGGAAQADERAALGNRRCV